MQIADVLIRAYQNTDIAVDRVEGSGIHIKFSSTAPKDTFALNHARVVITPSQAYMLAARLMAVADIAELDEAQEHDRSLDAHEQQLTDLARDK